MRTKVRRIISLLIAVALTLSLLPVSTMAEEEVDVHYETIEPEELAETEVSSEPEEELEAPSEEAEEEPEPSSDAEESDAEVDVSVEPEPEAEAPAPEPIQPEESAEPESAVTDEPTREEAPAAPEETPAEEPDPTQEETAEEPAESENVLEGKRNAPVLRVAAAPGSLQELINLIEDGESGTITLTHDYTENIVIPDGKTVTIDLNGYTITGKREGNGSVNAVTVYGDFTLTGNGTITSGGVSNIRGVTIASGATFYMKGGTITDFDVTGNGGGVRVENRGKLVMTGGEITGNSASDYGGGVFAYNGNTGLDLTGGTISNNTAPSGGGLAIYETGGGTTVGGVTIKNNTADTYGGGVYLAKQGTLNLKANIKGNSAPRGGGVYLYTGSTTTITGGEISGNQASVYGGGIYADQNNTLTISGGEISRNYTELRGGGIFLNSGYDANRSYLNLSGGVIDGNEVSETSDSAYGAGVYVSAGAQITITDGKISNNKNAISGGGIYTEVNCVIEMSGGEITGNSVRKNGSSGGNGGGVYLGVLNGTNRVSSITMTGGKITDNTASGNGGGIFHDSYSTAELSGGEISGNKATNGGGAYGETNARTNLKGNVIISQNEATAAGGGIRSGSTLIAENAQIINNKAGTSGGGIVTANNTTITGGKISGNTAGTYGGGLDLAGGNITNKISGGEISDNTAGTNGGGLRANANTTISGDVEIKDNIAHGAGGGIYSDYSITMAGGTIANNVADGAGGGVRVGNNAQWITMTGGTVSGNSAGTSGGGVSASGFAMTGGTISDNTAKTNGGGVSTGFSSNSDVTFTVSGGSITKNTAGGNGGGINFAGNRDTLTIKGGEITGNKAGGYGGGVAGLTSGNTVMALNVTGGKVSDNTAERYGMDVAVQTTTTEIAAAATMEYDGSNPAWYDELNSKNLTEQISVPRTTNGYYTYIYEDLDEVAQIGYTPYPTLQAAFTAIANDTASGTGILLLKDTKETVTVAENVTATLNLDGHTVKGNGASVFTVKKGADLTIDDTSDSGNGRITGGKGNPVTIGTTAATAGGGIYTEGKVTLKNGSIYNNSATYGAGVYVGPFGDFTMDGGKVRLNRNGRGVSVWYKDQVTELVTTGATATFTMNDGEISGNVGGVYADNANDSVNMNGGTISGNSFSGIGAGIYVNNGATLTMNGGEISGNTTTGTNRGGGIYVGTNSKAHIYDGEITGNTSGSNGGGGIAVCGANAELYVYGGKITNNNGGAYGGGISSSDNAKLVQIEGGEISGNTATYGGGVYGVTTTVNLMKDAKITGNTANSGGGGIFMNSGATLNMEGGEVTDNTTTNNGGGIYGGTGNGTHVNITGGLVTGNQAGGFGGGVVVTQYGSITGGQIYGNTAKGAQRGNDVVLREIRKENTPLIPAGNMNVDGVTCWLNDNTNEEYYETDQLASDRATAYYLTATNGQREPVARIGDETYLTLQAAIDAAEAGDEIFLLKDIEEFMTVSADQDVIVNFNGYTISTTATNGFTVDSGKLTLRDAPAEDGKEGGTGILKPAEGLTNGRGILARDSATITLESGTISGYTLTTANTSGAGIRALCSTVNITGGVIENCSATAYGAVSIDNATYNKPFHFNMSGGEIRNNTAITGGAIGINSGNNFENTTAITGGTISGNTANAGGGIYITGTAATNKNVVDIFGVTVEDNTAKLGSGGGIYINQTPQVTLGSPNADTIIQRNTCTGNGNVGGGVMISGAFDNPSIHVENVTITENSSVSSARAGGMYVSGSADIVDCKITDNTAYGNGGGLEVGRTAYTRRVNITDTEISGNKTTSGSGGGLYVVAESGDSTAVITLSGVTVENNTAGGTNGGGVYIEDGTNSAHVTLKNGTKVTGNTSNGANWDSGGGGIAVTGSKTTLELTNAEVTDNNNRSGSAGGIYVKGGAKLELNAGAKVAGNSTSGAGGGICTYGTNSTVTLHEGAEVSGNTARTSSGGGILVRTGGKLNMEDGAKISGNTAATSGGGVCVDSDAVMIMTGGEITGNETTGTAENWDAKYGGGGIYFGATNAAGSITGGTISGNKSAQDGGGILVAGDNNGNGVQNVIVDGATVTGNTAARNGGGVWAWHGTKFQLKSGGIYDNSAKLGQDVYAYYRSGYRSEVELIAASKMDFDGDKEGLGWLDEDNGNVIETDIQGKMVRRYALTLDYVNKDDVVAVIGDEEFATVQDAIAYIMEKDLSDAEIRIVKDVHENVNVPSGVKAKLNLNGYTLLGLPAAITCYGDLTIVDEPEDVTANDTDYPAGEGTGTITGHAASEGGGIQVKPGGTVTLESGQIANCTAVNNGAAVLVENGTFVMNRGTIKDNDAVSGAAVYVKSGSSTFTMNGGEITENTGRTGIVYNNGGKVNIYGGTISDNTLTRSGNSGGIGTVYNASGTMNIAGTADNPVEIKDNSVSYGGGGVGQVGGTVRITNAVIEGNKTTNARTTTVTESSGGGIYQNGGSMSIGDGTLITGNSAVRGGGIYQTGAGTITMMGGLITDNTASYAGGGVAQNPGTKGTFRLLQGGLYDNRSLLTDAGNDFYSKYEGTGTYNSGNGPTAILVAAPMMGNSEYNVWKDDNYEGETRSSDYIGEGQYITGMINNSNNLELTADYYADAKKTETISSDFQVATVYIRDDYGKDGMSDGTAVFDNSASKEKTAKDMLGNGASESTETYVYNGETLHYIEYNGKRYERTQAVEWEPGDDSGEKNAIVRSNDSVTYKLATTISPVDPDMHIPDEGYKTHLYVEAVLPCGYDEAEFDASTSGLAAYTVFEEQRDGKTVQILRGYWEKTMKAAGTVVHELKVRVKWAENGTTIQPTFKQWISGNEENTANPVVAPAKTLTVSAAGKYNVALAKNSMLSHTGYFDLDTGLEASEQDAKDTSRNIVYGTLMGYGLTVELYNTTAEKGLRGLELPKSPLEFDMRLNGALYLNGEPILGSDGKAAPYVWAYKENSKTDYGMALGGTTYSVNMNWNDVDDFDTNTQFAYDAAPINSGGGANACYSGGGWSMTGTQPTADDRETVLHFTVNDYAFDNSTNPTQNSADQNDSTLSAKNVKAFTAGYLQVIFPFDPDELGDNVNGFVAVNMEAAVSDLQIKTLSDQTPVSTEIGKDTLANYYGENDVDDHAVNEMRYADNYLNDQTGLYIFHGGPGGGDEIEVTNSYSGVSGNGIGARLSTHNGADGNSSTPLGTEVYINGALNYYSEHYRTDDPDHYPKQYIPDELFNAQTDNKEEFNYLTAMNLLQRFDGDVFKPIGTSAVVNKRFNNTGSTCNIGNGAFIISTTESKPTWDTSNTPATLGYNLTILYAAKPDGTNWKKVDLGNHTDDGGSADMDKYSEENLLYFTTMEELENYFAAQGKKGTCVGILYEFRNCCIRDKRSITVSSRMQSTDDFSYTGRTYATTNEARIWHTYRPDYKAARADGTLSDILYDFEWADIKSGNAIGKAYPTGTVLHTHNHATDVTLVGYQANQIAADNEDYSGYKKTEYKDGSQVPGTHNGWRAGNSILFYTLDSSISIRNTDIQRGSNRVQDTYNVSKGERIANFRIDPNVGPSSATKYHDLVINGSQTTDVTITLTLPKGLNYRDGSVAFDYSQDPERPGDKYEEGELNWNIEVKENPDGTTTLIFTTKISDVSKTLPDITYSASIGDAVDPQNDVKDGQSLTTQVSIRTGYSEENPVAANTKTDSVTIKVKKENEDGIFKSVRKILREVGDEFVFELTYANGSPDAREIKILDVMPYNGDGRGTEFHGGYRISSIVLSVKAEEPGNAVSTFQSIVNKGGLYYLGGQIVANENNLVPEQKALLLSAAKEGTKLVGDVNEGERTITYTLTNEMQVLATDLNSVALYGDFPQIAGNTTVHLELKMTPVATGKESETDLRQRLIADENDKFQTGSDVYWNDFFYKSMSDPVISNKVNVQVVDRTITGSVWMDQDQDGKITTALGDKMLKGINVTLYEVNENGEIVKGAKDILGNDVPSTETNEKGQYEFSNLAPGKYIVVFNDEDNNYATADEKHPIDFDMLSVTKQDESVFKLPSGNKSVPVYQEADAENSLASLNSAKLYKVVELPGPEKITTGHYISPNWNLGLYYIDAAIEKNWVNMVSCVSDGTKVTFPLTGKIGGLTVYSGKFTMTQEANDVTATGPDGDVMEVAVKSANLTAESSEPPTYTWRVSNIVLQAEGKGGKVDYNFDEFATLNGTALKNYTTTLTKTVGSDGITVFRAENSQKVGNFEFKKVAAEDMDLALTGAEFTLYRDKACTDEYKISFVSSGDGKYHPTYDGVEGQDNTTSVLEVNASTSDPITEGMIFLTALPYGTYYLKETKAPGGRRLPTGYWAVTISEDGVAITASSAEQPAIANWSRYDKEQQKTIDSYKLPNIRPMAVPFTGAYGVQTYLTLGFVLMLGGTTLFIVYRRRKRTQAPLTCNNKTTNS